jgi:hypothetical protein
MPQPGQNQRPKGSKAGNDVTAHAPSPAGSVPAAGAGGPSSTEADPPRRVLLAGTRGHTPIVLTPRVDGEVVVTGLECRHQKGQIRGLTRR